MLEKKLHWVDQKTRKQKEKRKSDDRSPSLLENYASAGM